MKARLNRDGFDRNPHDFKGGSYNYYYETKRGLEIYSIEYAGRLGVIPWRSIEASLRRKQAVQAAQQRAGESSATPCIWTENEDGVQETTYGEMCTCIDGGPTANGARLCCYCGRALREASVMAKKRKKR